jgi:hypothetical protein
MPQRGVGLTHSGIGVLSVRAWFSSTEHSVCPPRSKLTLGTVGLGFFARRPRPRRFRRALEVQPNVLKGSLE